MIRNTECVRPRHQGAFCRRCAAIAGVAAGVALSPPLLAGPAQVASVATVAPDVTWIASALPPSDGAQVDPTGRHVVAIEDLENFGRPELWSRPVAGGAPRLLSGATGPGDRVSAFRISPDGKWVAFATSSGDGAQRLFRIAIGGGPATRIDTDRSPITGDGLFAFRSDSRALGFLGGPERIPTVEVIDAIFVDGFVGGDSAEWSDTTPNACPTPTGGPTNHANSMTTSTWTANGSPHILTNNTLIPAGVTVTIEPCAEVRVHAFSDLTVQGTLIARGTPLQRITFKRDDPAQAWDSIWVRSPGFADLAFVDLSGGGAAGASVLVEGNDLLPPARPLLADHLKVIGSTSYGVRLTRRGGFHVDSRDLVVTGSGATDPGAPHPVRMSLNTVGTLPNGSYTGNASDLISVNEGGQEVEIDEAFHDRGIPYQIGGPAAAFGLITIDGNLELATLTIDPGVEIRFYTGGSNKGGLFVGKSGSPVATARIVAVGTPTAPILFTGAGGAPVAGSWEGVTFFGAMAVGDVLDRVQIDAAGAPGGDQGFGCPPVPDGNQTNGALKLFEQPSEQFLTNSTISRSSAHGVFRAWTGGEVDFLPGNSFEEVALCNQVLPTPLSLVCPDDPPCPQ